MLGMTWERTLNGALDEISRLQAERDNAYAALDALLEQHPNLEGNEHLTLARLALT
ncbi:hypothetical protein [Microbacterium sp. NPDC056052]|uniref:hypothetical protein n=1 Tax=Microbacterium sp. NPDC056052 TaxID=3345695 RepID=UPI0035E0A576